MYQGTQNRNHTYHTTPFRSSGMACEQQGFHHRKSIRSSNRFYSTFSHEYYNNVFHNSNITASNLDTSTHARGTIYNGMLLSSIMIEQTIIQVALSSIETFDGTKSKFEAWTESIENAVQIFGQIPGHIAFAKLTGAPLSTANRLKAWSPNPMWTECKQELSMQYSIIL